MGRHDRKNKGMCFLYFCLTEKLVPKNPMVVHRVAIKIAIEIHGCLPAVFTHKILYKTDDKHCF